MVMETKHNMYWNVKIVN